MSVAKAATREQEEVCAPLIYLVAGWIATMWIQVRKKVEEGGEADMIITTNTVVHDA